MELTKAELPVYELARRNTITEIAEYIRHNCLIPHPADEVEEHTNAVILSIADDVTRKMGTRDTPMSPYEAGLRLDIAADLRRMAHLAIPFNVLRATTALRDAADLVEKGQKPPQRWPG